MKFRRTTVGIACLMLGAAPSCGMLVGIDDFVDGSSSSGGTAGAGGEMGSSSSSMSGGGAGGCGDVQSNSMHCGECGHACANGYDCTNGQCGNDVVQISGGDTHNCAVLRNGELWCWGTNSNGQLGHTPGEAGDVLYGAIYSQSTPVRVTMPGNVVTVTGGANLNCAIVEGGAVYCWGSNRKDHCLLGNTDSTNCAMGTVLSSPSPVKIEFGEEINVVQLAMALETACARSEANSVYCWGYNGYAGLAQGTTTMWSGIGYKIVSTDLENNVIDISGGHSFGHFCALRSDKTMWCWGMNNYGQLGHAPGGEGDGDCGSFKCNGTPKKALESVASIHLATESTCAIMMDRSVKCWGTNKSGILGNGMATDGNVWSIAQTVTNVMADKMDGYEFSTFAIKSDGSLWGWGWNALASLGVGDVGGVACHETLSPLCITSATQLSTSPGVTFTKVAAAGRGGLALDRDGKVWAWGSNVHGQLGHAPGVGDVLCEGQPCSLKPVLVQGLPE